MFERTMRVVLGMTAIYCVGLMVHANAANNTDFEEEILDMQETMEPVIPDLTTNNHYEIPDRSRSRAKRPDNFDAYENIRDTDDDESNAQSRDHPRSRGRPLVRRTSRNRMQLALLGARLRQIDRINEMNNKERETRTRTSYAVSTDTLAATTQMFFLQRTVQTLTTTVSSLDRKVESLEKWKEDANERFMDMQTTILEMKAQLDAKSSPKVAGDAPAPASEFDNFEEDVARQLLLEEYFQKIEELQRAVTQVNRTMIDIKIQTANMNKNTDSSSGYKPSQNEDDLLRAASAITTKDYAVILKYTLNNAGAIKNITDALHQQQDTLEQQKNFVNNINTELQEQITALQNVIEKNDQQDASIQNMHEGGSSLNTHTGAIPNLQIAEIMLSMDEIRNNVTEHSSKLSILKNHMNSFRRCCRSSANTARKVKTQSRRISEVKTRSEIALKDLKSQRKQLSVISGQVTLQRNYLSGLRRHILSQKNAFGKSQKEVTDLIEKRYFDVNATMYNVTYDLEDKCRSFIINETTNIQRKMNTTIEDLSALSLFVGEQVKQQNEIQESLNDLEESHLENKKEMTLNYMKAQDSLLQREDLLYQLDEKILQVKNDMENHGNRLTQPSEETKQMLQKYKHDLENMEDKLKGHTSTAIEKSQEFLFMSMSNLTSEIYQLETKMNFHNITLQDILSSLLSIKSLNALTVTNIDTLDIKIEEQNLNMKSYKNEMNIKVDSGLSNLKSLSTRCTETRTALTELNNSFIAQTNSLRNMTTHLDFQASKHQIALGNIAIESKQFDDKQTTLNETLMKLIVVTDERFKETNEFIFENEKRLFNIEANANDGKYRLDELTQSLSVRFHAITSNLTYQGEQVIALDKKTTTLSSGIEVTRGEINFLNKTIHDLTQNVAEVKVQYEENKKKYGIIHSGMGVLRLESEQTIQSLTEISNFTTASIEGLQRVVQMNKDNTNEQIEGLQGLLSDCSTNINNLGELVSTNELNIMQQTQLLNSVNSSFHVELDGYRSNVDVLKDGVLELKSVDKAVNNALKSHEDAISQQKLLQKNLTSASEEVKDLVEDQSEALDFVEEIIKKLNNTVFEGQNEIEDALSTRLKQQQDTVNSLSRLMHNFTTLVNNVIKDKISQDLTISSLETLQYSLSEIVDNHDTSLQKLFNHAGDIHGSVVAVKERLDDYKVKLENSLIKSNDQERKIQTLDVTASEFREALSSVDDKLSRKYINIESTLRGNGEFLTAQSELLTSLDEKVANLKKSADSSISNIQESLLEQQGHINIQRSTAEKLQLDADATVKMQMEMNNQISALETKSELFTNSLEMLTETQICCQFNKQKVESTIFRVSSLENERSAQVKKTESLYEDISLLQKKINIINEDIDGINSTFGVSSNITMDTSMFENIYKNVTALGENLENAINKHYQLIQKIESDSIDNEIKLEMMEERLATSEVKFSNLNSSTAMFEKSLENVRNIVQAQSTSLRSLHEAGGSASPESQNVKKDVVKQDGKLKHMALVVRQVVEDINNLKVKTRNLEDTSNVNHEAVLKMIENIEFKQTSTFERLNYIEFDVEMNYNMSQNAFNSGQDASAAVDSLNSTFSNQIYSIASSFAMSISDVDYNLRNVNNTHHKDMSNLTTLLSDFQKAFDTSNRQMARYSSNLHMLELNATHNYDYISTNIDYIAQIVKEANAAITENSDRINVINETFLFLRNGVNNLTSLDEKHLHEESPDFEDGTSNILNTDGSLSYADSEDDYIEAGDNKQSVPFIGDADGMRIYPHDASENWRTELPQADDSDFQTENFQYEDDDIIYRARRSTPSAYNVEREVRGLSRVTKKLEKKIANVTSVINNKPMVAFSTGLSHSFSCCGVVKFDRVFTNEGSGFNQTLGHFIVPQHGLYHFTVAISERNKFVDVSLVVNHQPKISLQLDHEVGDYEKSQSSNTIILVLNKNDIVSVEIYSGTLAGHQTPITTFSGYKL